MTDWFQPALRNAGMRRMRSCRKRSPCNALRIAEWPFEPWLVCNAKLVWSMSRKYWRGELPTYVRRLLNHPRKRSVRQTALPVRCCISTHDPRDFSGPGSATHDAVNWIWRVSYAMNVFRYLHCLLGVVQLLFLLVFKTAEELIDVGRVGHAVAAIVLPWGVPRSISTGHGCLLHGGLFRGSHTLIHIT